MADLYSYVKSFSMAAYGATVFILHYGNRESVIRIGLSTMLHQFPCKGKHPEWH